MAAPARGPSELDDELLESCRQGDPQGLRSLYETYKDRVYSLARHFSGDETLAWDLTQEIFLRLFTRLAEFRGDAKFDTWLFRIVVNACIDERRKRQRFVSLESVIAPRHGWQKRPQEAHYSRFEAAEAVRAAVARLRPALRAPILLRYMEGLSYEQIAETLGCKPGTVAARLYRGHRILAKELAAFREVVS